MVAQSPQHDREPERHADGIDDYGYHDVRKPGVIRRARAADRRVNEHDLDVLVPVVGLVVRPGASVPGVRGAREISKAIGGCGGDEAIERKEDPVCSSREDLGSPRPIHARAAQRADCRDHEDDDDGRTRETERPRETEARTSRSDLGIEIETVEDWEEEFREERGTETVDDDD